MTDWLMIASGSYILIKSRFQLLNRQYSQGCWTLNSGRQVTEMCNMFKIFKTCAIRRTIIAPGARLSMTLRFIKVSNPLMKSFLEIPDIAVSSKKKKKWHNRKPTWEDLREELRFKKVFLTYKWGVYFQYRQHYIFPTE